MRARTGLRKHGRDWLGLVFWRESWVFERWRSRPPPSRTSPCSNPPPPPAHCVSTNAPYGRFPYARLPSRSPLPALIRVHILLFSAVESPWICVVCTWIPRECDVEFALNSALLRARRRTIEFLLGNALLRSAGLRDSLLDSRFFSSQGVPRWVGGARADAKLSDVRRRRVPAGPAPQHGRRAERVRKEHARLRDLHRTLRPALGTAGKERGGQGRKTSRAEKEDGQETREAGGKRVRGEGPSAGGRGGRGVVHEWEGQRGRLERAWLWLEPPCPWPGGRLGPRGRVKLSRRHADITYPVWVPRFPVPRFPVLPFAHSLVSLVPPFSCSLVPPLLPSFPVLFPAAAAGSVAGPEGLCALWRAECLGRSRAQGGHAHAYHPPRLWRREKHIVLESRR